MECSCGNISRFEVYRIELTRLVLDFKLVNSKRWVVPSAVEHQRVIETGQPIAVVCIKCGTTGPPSNFNYSEKEGDLMKPEYREGHNIPEEIPLLSRIKVKVKF